jgi:hypothetical protein
MGKLHFGIILGWSVVQSVALYFVVNQLAGADSSEKKALDLYSCCCLVGYCMAPICLASAVGLMVPRWAAAGRRARAASRRRRRR